jgi:hypothetical protein
MKLKCMSTQQVGSEQDGGSTPVFSSYQTPQPTSFNVHNVSLSQALSTRGQNVLYIDGTNFGPLSEQNIITATYHNPNLIGVGGDVFNATNCEVNLFTWKY